MNSKPHQQPLEMSPGMSITMVVVMLIGWMGWANLKDEESTFEQQVRPIIQRIADRAIQLDQFSIVIQPTAGWSYLQITNEVQADPTFVNPGGNAVVEFLPPTAGETPVGRKVQYNALEIVWTSNREETRHEGWILHNKAKLRIRAMTDGGNIDADPAITALCNSIQPIQ